MMSCRYDGVEREVWIAGELLLWLDRNLLPRRGMIRTRQRLRHRGTRGQNDAADANKKVPEDAQVNSTIESSMQRAESRGLNREKALALLKKGESDSYGKAGCGIEWSKPEDQSMGDPPGSRATVFRCDSCNCQARIIYQGDSVVALVLSSAC